MAHHVPHPHFAPADFLPGHQVLQGLGRVLELVAFPLGLSNLKTAWVIFLQGLFMAFSSKTFLADPHHFNFGLGPDPTRKTGFPPQVGQSGSQVIVPAGFIGSTGFSLGGSTGRWDIFPQSPGDSVHEGPVPINLFGAFTLGPIYEILQAFLQAVMTFLLSPSTNLVEMPKFSGKVVFLPLGFGEDEGEGAAGDASLFLVLYGLVRSGYVMYCGTNIVARSFESLLEKSSKSSWDCFLGRRFILV